MPNLSNDFYFDYATSSIRWNEAKRNIIALVLGIKRRWRKSKYFHDYLAGPDNPDGMRNQINDCLKNL